MEGNVTRTLEFLREQFENSKYLMEHPEAKKYRYEHTLRVANIGKKIGQEEGLNEEMLIIACLLHDLSYVEYFETEEDWLNHGRAAAKMARPFLETLQLTKEQVDEICYGIAIHVDDKADFDGERTPLALSIGDCDNIDRFDVFRIHENLNKRSFINLPLVEQKEFVAKTLANLARYKELEFATKTATKLWWNKIDFQMDFFERLQGQLQSSGGIL